MYVYIYRNGSLCICALYIGALYVGAWTVWVRPVEGSDRAAWTFCEGVHYLAWVFHAVLGVQPNFNFATDSSFMFCIALLRDFQWDCMRDTAIGSTVSAKVLGHKNKGDGSPCFPKAKTAHVFWLGVFAFLRCAAKVVAADEGHGPAVHFRQHSK